MATFGIAMVKDEADIIGPVISHILTQVDEIIVADNRSTDGTREILESFPITVIDDPEVGYYQSFKMTSLARVARNQGAEWVVPFDADEIWYSPFGVIKEILGSLGPQWLVASAALYDHVSSSKDDLTILNPIRRIGWRRSYPGTLHKVACRYRDDLVIQQGNHGAWYQGGGTQQDGLLTIRHFPYRSPEQFIRKAKNGAAAYAATNLDEDTGAHWRGYGRILKEHGEDALADVFYTWFYLHDPQTALDVIYDPVPV
jgi:glycosyltransferase involved in cell wall biosynthesis